MSKKIVIIILGLVCLKTIQAQYISEVLEYKPAPGQFINSSPWGIPNSAKSLIGGVTGSMSLGAFGGYVIFKFANPVENDANNPFGVDFTIFGNPLNEWSEQGIVSVMKDENGNGLPDDTWYELAGSDYFFSNTIKKYEVTYTNPNQSSSADVPWADNKGNSGAILANGFHAQPYYPLIDSFPDIASNEYTLSGTRVADEVDRTNPSCVNSYRKAFGYVDNQLRGSAPYTVPDNPYTPEKENSGGDAFDISWAVDEDGNYVDLDKIDFVKVHNAVLADAGWLGEVSTEITGAVDVAPNHSITGISEIIVLKELPDTIVGNRYQIEAFAFDYGRWDKEAKIKWDINLADANINAENLLSFSSSGRLTVIASLEGNPSIIATDSAVLIYQNNPTSVSQNNFAALKLYPNPASENIYIEVTNDADVEIYEITGIKVMTILNYQANQPVSIAHLANGIYIIKISEQNECITLRFVKD
ncbi:MAG: T9SS type A sorting domain-containing protein [Bacteroidales bacterium]|nr:T9SS type A sorting domain-containing protein [Bacteroidales bacterium]